MTGPKEFHSILDFIQSIEKLKDTLRSAYTSQGKQESTAEHTWRLCILVMIFHKQYFPELDFEKLIKIALVHDLGEALNGDIPAPEQEGSKTDSERADLLTILRPLPPDLQSDFLSLWEEYEAAETEEAKIVKALDKMETLIQHNQGRNPDDFDYGFNLNYGKRHTDRVEMAAEFRKILDAETMENMKNPGSKKENEQIPESFKNFYANIQHRLKDYFSDIENRVNHDPSLEVNEAIFIKRLNTIIISNLANPEFNVESLSRSMAISSSKLFRKLKSITGYSPGNYIRTFRIQKAREMLKDEIKVPIGTIALKTGFIDQSHFTRTFKNTFGQTPHEYRSSKND
jgi:putative hydrolase of HD superfamily